MSNESETEINLTLKVKVEWVEREPEITTTDEANRSETIPVGVDILAVITNDVPFGINITNLLSEDELQSLCEEIENKL